jgi:hypothetical protein
MCTSKGITALAAIDRAEEALRCSLDSGRCLGHNSPEHADKAGTLYRMSAKLVVNMMIAQFDGEAELGQLWNIARELLDSLVCNPRETATALYWTNALVLPPKPTAVLFADKGCAGVKELSMCERVAVCTDRKLWACDVIVAIAVHFKDLLPARAQSAEQEIRAQKTVYCADAVRCLLEAFYRHQANLCAGQTTASIYLDCCALLMSPAVHDDLQCLLAALPKTAHYSVLMDGEMPQCASPFWYMRARESIGEKLCCAATTVGEVARVGTAAELLAKHLREQYAAIMSAVQASQLFTQPTGDLTAEYDMLYHGMRLISDTAVQDWAFYEHCAAKLASAATHRGLSTAHALTAECWAEANVALQRCLFERKVQYEWDIKVVNDIVGGRTNFWKAALGFARLADGLVAEVNRLNTAATNSTNAGRLEAAQLWGEAADLQCQITKYLYTRTVNSLCSLVDDARVQLWDIDYPDLRLEQMAALLSKVMQLAQLLDSAQYNSSAQAPQSQMTTAPVTAIELLKHSVAHCRINCPDFQAGGSPYRKACAFENRALEHLYDAYLAATTRATLPEPTALLTRLPALRAVEQDTTAALAQTVVGVTWLPECLVECSALLMTVTHQSDLSIALQDDVLACVYHFINTAKPVTADAALYGGATAPHSPEAFELAGRLCTAYIRAGRAILDNDVDMRCVCMKAAEHYKKAQTTVGDNLANSYSSVSAILVADGLLSYATQNSARHAPLMPVGTLIRPYIAQICAPSVEQIVELMVQTVALDSVSFAAAGKEDVTLRSLQEKARTMYQLAIDDAFELAKRRLIGKEKATRQRLAIERLEWHSALARACGRRYHTAAQALADPLTPVALFRSLHGLVRIAEGRLQPVLYSCCRRIGPRRLEKWFRKAAAARCSGTRTMPAARFG